METYVCILLLPAENILLILLLALLRVCRTRLEKVSDILLCELISSNSCDR